ncbi:mitochondrial molecular chaperone DnaJ [Andalucia godoyi]|uniref:Mitochondrial molecular chaperone DnaJ n=1 Tax=Andalucia godoyi TaxID=505711 RepID=A0A8K0AHY9_ANDGO|nr:mitochondrial molecular chaperone DnaJ [Andalucia godoyi]|eukprot:ANDGO_02715.mRNA.1 mitochondrial molecular chaperone DnaJ
MFYRAVRERLTPQFANHTRRFFASFDKDPYAVLGVSKTADDQEIKKKYRDLAKKYHPDVNKAADARDKFTEISAAYEILSNAEKRRQYDTFGTVGEDFGRGGPSAGGAGGPGGFGHPFGGAGFSAEDIFGELFGAGKRGKRASAGGRPGSGAANGMSGGPVPGNDIQMSIHIPFMEAVHGSTRDVSVNSKASCTTCSGSGAKPGTSAKTCPECKGSGRVIFQSGFFSFENVCSRCGGSGQTIANPCVTCSGSGRMEQTKTITITVPQGVDNGVTLRIPNKGEAGIRGGPSGHLYVDIRVDPDPFFRREGADVHTDVHLSLVEALLGGNVTIPTLSGEVELKIPEGVQHNDERVLRAKGIKRLHESGHGNHYVHFKVDLPSRLNAKQRELIEQFAAEGGERSSAKREGMFKTVFNKVKSFMDSKQKSSSSTGGSSS